MHILHIANSYGGTEVYKNLFMALDSLGVRQTVFVPLNPNNHNRIGNHLIDFTVKDSKIIYSTVLKKHHRFIYFCKISTITKCIATYRSQRRRKLDLCKVTATIKRTISYFF